MNIKYVVLALLCLSYTMASQLTHEGSTGALVSESGHLELASDPEAQAFVKAVQENDAEAAVEILQECNSELREYCGKHLANLGQSKLVNIYKVTKKHDKIWILKLILVHVDQELLNNILNELKPDDNVLSSAMHSAALVCNINKFINVLKRITDKEKQTFALEQGVWALLLANKLEGFNPLLTSLRDDTSLGQYFIDGVIRGIFESASECMDKRALCTKDFFAHPAVTTKSYYLALVKSYRYGSFAKELFYWLLERADRQDLKKTMEDKEFSTKSPEFRKAITQALEIVGTETRHERGKRERGETTTLVMVTLAHVPTTLIDVILGYYFGW